MGDVTEIKAHETTNLALSAELSRRLRHEKIQNFFPLFPPPFSSPNDILDGKEYNISRNKSSESIELILSQEEFNHNLEKLSACLIEYLEWVETKIKAEGKTDIKDNSTLQKSQKSFKKEKK